MKQNEKISNQRPQAEKMTSRNVTPAKDGMKRPTPRYKRKVMMVRNIPPARDFAKRDTSLP